MLVANLVRDGFDVAVALWVKTSEEGLWYFYVGSQSVESMPLADAYRTAYSALTKIPNSSLTLSQIKLIGSQDVVASDAIKNRDSFSDGRATTFIDITIGNLPCDVAYIYPRPAKLMSSDEVVLKIADRMNRPIPYAFSLITLRDGTEIHAIPVGIQLNDVGAIQLVLQDLNDKAKKTISADEVASIL